MTAADCDGPRRLEDLATIERDAITPAEIRMGTQYVGLEHITSDGHFIGVKAVSEGELASNKFRFGPQHILFGKLRPYLKKTARPNFQGICSTDIVPILPGPWVDRNYLFHFLRHPKTVEQAVRRSTGANLPRLSPRDLAAFQVPVPPLAEQRRIAHVLDMADIIRRKRRDAIAITERLLRSVFLEMFGDPVTNPKGWDEVPLSKLGRITTGNTPSRAVPDYFGDNIEWIKSDNINTPSHILTRAAEGLSAKGRAEGRTAPAGSTLMTCIAGTPDCIGNVALADREVAFNQQINAITPHGDVDHRYLYVLLLLGKRLVQAASTNSMKGMVSKGRLEDVLFPSPPPRMQAEFGEAFDRVLALRRRQEAGWTETDRLFNAVLGNAFGELAPVRAGGSQDMRPA